MSARSSSGLEAPVRAVIARVRLARALERGTSFAALGLTLAGLVLAGRAAGVVSPPDARWALPAVLALALAGALSAALQRVSELACGRMLDRAHGLEGRLTSALELSRAREAQSARERALARLAIADARARVGALDPAKAAPLAAPRHLAATALLAAGVGFLYVVEPPRPPTPPAPPPPPGIVPIVLHADDLSGFDERLRDLADAPDLSPEVRSQAEAFSRIVEDLSERRLERAEALRRLMDLESQLAARAPADPTFMAEELADLGRALSRSERLDAVAQALRQDDPEAAAEALRRAAGELEREAPSRRELDALRRALEAAAAEARDEQAESLQERESEMESLLRRREEGSLSEREQSLLERRERELERLRREHAERSEARRELERLRRELGQSAEELSRGGEDARASAGEAMERGAQDLNRIARDQMSQDQLRELREQMRQLRELVQRQREEGAGGQDGSGEGEGEGERGGGQSRMDRFVLRARGEGEGEGMPLGMPGAGSGEGEGGGQEGGEGQAEGGQSAGAQGSGAPGGSGEGAPDEGSEMLVLGGAGGSSILEMPGLGAGSEPGGEAEGSGPGAGEGGSGAGDSHESSLDADPTRLSGSARTVAVSGEARGRAPTRSEVIQTATARGFASRAYESHYEAYAEHAEEVLEREQIPAGYRYYVRRYFQLIRPRSAGDER